MSKEVRSIFIILIGTVVVIVLSAFLTEIINVSLNSIKLQSDVKLACNKALTLFAQESYKPRSTGGTVYSYTINQEKVKNCEGGDYVTGVFYEGIDSSMDADTVVSTIYNNLYLNNDNFRNWYNSSASNGISFLNGTTIAGTWETLDRVGERLNATYTGAPDPEEPVSFNDFTGTYDEYLESLNEYSNFMVGKTYLETYTTPLNMGVPYLDKDTVQKMFRWNLAQLLSNCNPDAIVKDDAGTFCVERDGFHIYADRATITKLE